MTKKAMSSSTPTTARPRRQRYRTPLWVLAIRYALMTIAVIAISTVCILMILGYQINFQKKTLEQGGLLQFRSVPSGASISLDNTTLSFVTPGRHSTPAGMHRVTLTKPGYHTWQKDFPLRAGELRWVNTARLVPTDITTEIAARPEALTQLLATPDRKFIATLGDQTRPTVAIYDIRGDSLTLPEVSYTIPAALLTVRDGESSQFRLVEWDFGGKFLLVEHSTPSHVEYIRLTRGSDGGELRNITREFSLPFREMHFSGTSGNILYGLTERDLRRVDIGAKSVTQPIVTGVEQYRLYREHDIAYVTSNETTRTAGVVLDDTPHAVRQVSIGQPLLVDLTKYFQDYYLTVVTGRTVELIKSPAKAVLGAPKASFTSSVEAAWLDFSSSGRIILVGNGTNYSAYDIETSELFTVAGSGSTGPTSPLRWIDDFSLYNTSTGILQLGEYDGTNRHDITSVISGSSATLSESSTYLYSIGRGDTDKTVLHRSRMILE